MNAKLTLLATLAILLSLTHLHTATAGSDCDAKDLVKNCNLSSYATGGHSLWIPGLSGIGSDYHFETGTGKFQEYTNGRARLTGIVVNEQDPTKAWSVSIWLAHKSTWAEWSANGGGYKDEQNLVSNEYQDWDYYIIDTTKLNRLKGLNGLQGSYLNLSHMPSNFQFGFQIGKKANSKNAEYGMACWFYYDGKVNGQWVNGHGDVNVNSDCSPGAYITPADTLTCTDPTTELAAGSPHSNVTYAWSGPGGFSSASQNPTIDRHGKYTVTVTSEAGCSSTAYTTVARSQKRPIIKGSHTQTTCSGMSDASLDINVWSGATPYTYTWSNGATTQDISNLNKGIYYVTVTGSNGCQTTKKLLVRDPKFRAHVTVDHVSCFEGNDGGALAKPISGTAPFNFAWSSGASNAQVTNLTAGVYNVTVTDVNGCSTSKAFKVRDGRALGIRYKVVNATCVNPTGSITTIISNSQFKRVQSTSWNTGATTLSLSNVSAGTYYLTIHYDNGCVRVDTFTIQAPPCCNVAAAGEIGNEQAACGGFDPAPITSLALPSGGIGSLEYVWLKRLPNQNHSVIAGANGPTYDPGFISQTTQYRRCVRRSGCSAYIGESNWITMTVNNPFTVTSAVTNASTTGGTNGAIDLSVNSGTSPFVYQWSTGATTQDISGIGAGVYTVVIYDAGGCSATETFTITQPSYSAECVGFRTQTQGGWGQCQQNGNNPGAYLAQNFASAFPNGLTIGCGTRFMQLTSSNAVCSFLPSGSSPALLPNGMLINPGSAYNNVLAGQLVAATLNIGFDNYDASFGSSNLHLQDLIINTGTFNGWTVAELLAEANSAIGGCSSSYSLSSISSALTSINENFVDGGVTGSFLNCCNITVDVVAENGTCANNNQGSLSAYGGTAYAWSNGATTASINGLVAGTYTVTATNANGCSATASAAISVVECCNVTSAGQIGNAQENCGGFDPQAITSISLPSGGLGTIEYVWLKRLPNQNHSVIAGANGPTYDPGFISQTTQYRRCARRNGCSAYIGESNWITMTVNNQATALITSENGTCSNNNLGSAAASGGTAYAWNNGATTASINGLVAGTYTVTATNANGCSATASATISVVECCNVTSAGQIGNAQENCGGFDPQAITSISLPSGGLGTIEYVWLKRLPNQNHSVIAGANGPTYDPGFISQTTQYRRCARRNGCSAYIGESNWITMTVNDNCIVPPSSPTCGTGNFLWENDINVNNLSGSNGIPQVGIRLVDGNTEHYVIPGPYPAAFNAEVYVSIDEAISWDAYLTRANTGNQPNEQWRVIFEKNGSIVHTTSYTGDLATGTQSDEWSGSLGSNIYLPQGADKIIIAHYEHPTYGSGGSSSANSVVPVSLCLSYTPACDNVTNAGEIGNPQTGCGPFDPDAITSVTLPSGGSGALEYVWLQRQPGGSASLISGANGSSYDPGMITETTEYRRCARRNGCTSYIGESNWVTVKVKDAPEYSTKYNVDNGGWTHDNEVTVCPGQKLSLGIYPYSFSSVSWTGPNGFASNVSHPLVSSSVTTAASGVYTVVATNENGCSTTSTINVHVMSNCCGEITAIKIYDQNTDQEVQGIGALANGMNIFAGDLPTHYYLAVEATNTIESVKITVNGNGQNVENIVPYTWPNGGENGSNWNAGEGGYTVKAWAYKKDNLQSLCDEKEITFYIVSCDNVTDAGQIGNEQTGCGAFDPEPITSASMPSGGSGVLEYVWLQRLPGGNASLISGAHGATYDPGVLNQTTEFRRCARRNGCTEYVGESNWVTMNVYPQLTASATSTNGSCNGNTAASLQASAQGGTTPYTYLWSNGATSALSEVFGSGTYTVTVTDANGCTSIASAIVVAPTPMSLSFTTTNTSFAGATGTATVSVSGGDAPYSYLWNNGSTAQTATGLAYGDHAVTVTDNNGCQVVDSAFVSSQIFSKNAAEPAQAEIASELSMTLYPNPLRAGVSLSLKLTGVETGQTAHIQVYDVVGHLVYTDRTGLTQGVNTIQLENFRAPAAGTYLLRVTMSENTMISRFQVRE